MVSIKFCRQEVERIIELLEMQPNKWDHDIADGLRQAIGWKCQADDEEYASAEKILKAQVEAVFKAAIVPH